MNEQNAGPEERAEGKAGPGQNLVVRSDTFVAGQRPADRRPADQRPARPDSASGYDPPGTSNVDGRTGETGGTDASGDSGDADHAAAVSRWRQQSKQRNSKAKRPFWVELPILIVVAFVLTFLIQTFVAKVYYVPSGSMEQTLHGVQSGGDRILALKVVYDFRDPAPGDVVVFKGPDTWAPEADIPGPTTWFGKLTSALGSVIGIAPPNEKDFVKRVIAVGGQTVACCDKQGNLTVDGKSLNEPYIYQPLEFEAGVADCTTGGDDTYYASRRCFAPFKVPAGQLWVMGDHRSDSADSSYLCLSLKAERAATYLQPGGSQGCARPIPVDDVIGKAIFIVMPPSRWGTIGNPDIYPQATALASGPVPALPATGGLLLTLGLRGSLALTPRRRRRRRDRRFARRSAGAVASERGGRTRP